MKRTAVVDYTRCVPLKCSPEKGECAAAKACQRKVLVQLDVFDCPAIQFGDFCMGCDDCTIACLPGAIRVI